MCLTIFAATKKGISVIKALNMEYPNLINLVVGARNKNEQNDYYDDIKSYCINNNIEWVDRHQFIEVNTPYSLAISWRWLIKADSTGLIVLHDSLLPKYRGFNPLVSCLINGELIIGVTAIHASSNYDCGDIIFSDKTFISYPLTINEAVEKVTQNYINIALKIAAAISNDEKLPSTPQDNKEATYSLWRNEDDYKIDWNSSATQINRFIDAVGYPYKGASTFIDSKKVRVINSEVINDVKIENRNPGKIIFYDGAKPVVVCGTGLLKIREAIYDETGKTIFPLNKFRIHFK